MIKVLLADDHAIVRGGLKQILESDPIIRVVSEASNGNEAIDFVRGGAVTLVAMLIFRPLVPAVVNNWHSNPVYSNAIVVTIATAVAAESIWKLFHVVPRARLLFLAGLVGGITLIVTG